jgi:hypothetical protein
MVLTIASIHPLTVNQQLTSQAVATAVVQGLHCMPGRVLRKHHHLQGQAHA